MIKVVLIEDEAIAARRLKKLLAENELEVVNEIQSVKDSIKYFSELVDVQLIFMDIHLNDGIVFEIFEEVEITIPIIFTTAYDQYAIKAFKQNSIDYLLKPIDKLELKQAIKKFKSLKSSSLNFDLHQLQTLLKPQDSNLKTKSRFKVKIGDRFKTINTNDIVCIYSEDKINFIKSTEGRSFPIDSSLNDTMESLDNDQFFKINRSCIVNINYLDEIISYSNSRLKLICSGKDPMDFIVARDRVSAFKDWLG